MRKYLFALAALSLLMACTPEENGADNNQSGNGSSNLAPSVTVEAKDVSAISAVLAGKANLGSTVASDLKVGFQYSKSAGILPSNSTTIEATDADASYNYTAAITGLEPATKYYFRSFVRQNGRDTYGETKEFTTKDVASLLETRGASGVEAAKATLNAKLDLTDVLYKSLAYGFLWGTSESALNTDYKCTEIKDNAISAPLTGLSHKTQYWYKAYVKLDKLTFYGEVKAFTTDVVPVESVSLDKTEYTFNTIGNTLTLKATVLPADATDKSVEWSSDKEDVAAVDANGRVTAKGNGKATIAVTTNDQGKSATCVITVAQWVTGISLDKTSITLNEGQEQTLIPTVNPSNAADKSLNWVSSDTSVATVNAEGKVTAVSKGTATIKAEAKDGSGAQATCEVEVKQNVTISLNKTSLSLEIGDEVTLSVTILPDNANDKTYTWSSSDSAIASVDNSGKVTAKAKGKATIKAIANDGSGVNATCSVVVSSKCPAGAVDMGTTTADGYKLYWGTSNLGAGKPEEYGDYYAWGETAPKENYSWSTYKFRTSGDSYDNVKFSKYNSESSFGPVDNKTVLEPEDDVAHVKLGGKWRMPTDAEWTELRIKCTWTWTTNYNDTGVKGRIVTATNGNSIFLPAAGYRYDTDLFNDGSQGLYWSSSLNTGDPPYARGAGFSFSSGTVYGGTCRRYYGQSVRPVSE